ncbi:putative neurobeachin [Triplophysa rosa]|uniref:Neurobeachin n=1 Tax=Triplophysa rosa TaxID=992332 RepID=A0A9W7TPJ7_TRIRA|nr:putative neurobeachin [Triplophysa rosa]
MASVPPLDREPVSGHRQHGSAAAASCSGTGDTMRMSCSGSVVLPAGVMHPSVPIRNIKMKFAVLAGLIQVGEVGNRDIVETVLNLACIASRGFVGQE